MEKLDSRARRVYFLFMADRTPSTDQINFSSVARELSVTRQTVWGWFNGDRARVPAERVFDVERVTGISRHELRPDIYPRGKDAAA